MTRAEAVKEYFESVKGLDLDRVAMRCGFVEFIDQLQKSGRITEHQAFSWEGLKGYQPGGKYAKW